MIKSKGTPRQLSRRQALRMCLAPAGLAAAQWLSACADPRASTTADGDGNEPPRERDASQGGRRTPDGGDGERRDAGNSASRDAGDQASAPGSPSKGDQDAGEGRGVDAGQGSQSDQDAGADADTRAVPWASGGTKSMTGGYPDPFASAMPGAMCALYPAQTLGPCYAMPVAAREDISEGTLGLPLRLSFLVVRADGCTPVPNAEVDIWHTGHNGVYSAFASGICNPDRVDVARERFCRGKQSTNANGRVDFSTVFPGWYSGRTIHIHFTVRVGSQAYITSQLYFEDALCDEIMQQAADYRARGPRDTTNRNDSQLDASNAQPFLFSSVKRADGALHAWKVLSIRA